MTNVMTECECLQPGFCQRHQCHKTAHWHRLCQTRDDYFGLWEEGRGPGQGGEGKIRRPVAAPKTVAVVVVCHNYGRFLTQCVESVLSQSRRADEIIIVDDSSTDDTPVVAESFRDRGVRFLRVDVRNVHLARKAGYAATTTEALCFLDADDYLAHDYIERGLAEFVEPRVAIVYSDCEFFGSKTGRKIFPVEYQRGDLQRDNFIHAGSVVRRDALDSSGVFELLFDPLFTQGDWFLWRRVLRGNWVARRQSGLYFYRQHPENWMHSMRREQRADAYFDYAGLAHEDVTLFVALSGREWAWPRFADFLTQQRWPHDQTRLVLFDTSHSEQFSHAIRRWICDCDYRDVRHLRQAVAPAGLADDNRRDQDVRQQVASAMCRIYNRMLELVETEYIWVVEDDILPPLDACERLMRGFDQHTASVAGVYQSRFHAGYVAWMQDGRPVTVPASGKQLVAGNGFGCTVLRRSALKHEVFSGDAQVKDFDIAFYRRLGKTTLSAKIDWDCACEHFETPNDVTRAMSEDNRVPFPVRRDLKTSGCLESSPGDHTASRGRLGSPNGIAKDLKIEGALCSRGGQHADEL